MITGRVCFHRQESAIYIEVVLNGWILKKLRSDSSTGHGVVGSEAAELKSPRYFDKVAVPVTHITTMTSAIRGKLLSDY